MIEELNHSGYINIDKTINLIKSQEDIIVINDDKSFSNNKKHYAYEYKKDNQSFLGFAKLF